MLDSSSEPPAWVGNPEPEAGVGRDLHQPNQGSSSWAANQNPLGQRRFFKIVIIPSHPRPTESESLGWDLGQEATICNQNRELLAQL